MSSGSESIIWKQQQELKSQPSGMSFRASGSMIICSAMVILLALAMLGQVECQEQLNIESRQKIDGDDLNDTMKYLSNLERLDKYFSQIARPRFGRSESKQLQFQQPIALVDPIRSNLMPNAESARYGSLVELINSRLAQKYRDTNY